MHRENCIKRKHKMTMKEKASWGNAVKVEICVLMVVKIKGWHFLVPYSQLLCYMLFSYVCLLL